MICIQQNRVLIKYYQSIMTLEDHLLEIKMNKQIVSIQGTHLEIQYYSQDEILVHGQLSAIQLT